MWQNCVSISSCWNKSSCRFRTTFPLHWYMQVAMLLCSMKASEKVIWIQEHCFANYCCISWGLVWVLFADLTIAITLWSRSRIWTLNNCRVEIELFTSDLAKLGLFSEGRRSLPFPSSLFPGFWVSFAVRARAFLLIFGASCLFVGALCLSARVSCLLSLLLPKISTIPFRSVSSLGCSPISSCFLCCSR